MSQWAGQITVMDRQGRVVGRGRATLDSTTARGRPSWTGSLVPAGFLALNVGELYEVRLPDGRAGKAFITVSTGQSPTSGRGQMGTLRGAGPAPF